MKKLAILAAGAALLMAMVPVLAKGPSAPAGNSNVGHLYLYEKNPESWSIVEDGAWGKMKYELSGSEFCYVFNGHGLEPDTGYSLIYYADPWPGDNPGALIASGTSNKGGNINMVGCEDLGMDLPDLADANYDNGECGDPNTPGNPPDPLPCGGAKIWLVPSADYNEANHKMIAWDPTEYLFEHNLIIYNDLEYEVSSVDLCQKTTSWDCDENGTRGTLSYKASGPVFAYHFEVNELAVTTDYSLIYYADPWPGNHPGALIGTSTTDESGHLLLKGTKDLGMDLPHSADANYSTGAKIWLVRSAHYNPSTNSMTAWVRSQILFEEHFITYDDTDVP